MSDYNICPACGGRVPIHIDWLSPEHDCKFSVSQRQFHRKLEKGDTGYEPGEEPEVIGSIVHDEDIDAYASHSDDPEKGMDDFLDSMDFDDDGEFG